MKPTSKGDVLNQPLPHRTVCTPIVCLLAIVTCLCAALPGPAAAYDIYAPLKQRLIQDGLRPNVVSLAFQPPPPPQYKIVALTFRIREGKRSYAQFLTPASIAKAQQFLDRHAATFARAESASGVDRRVIAAILLVETRFGSYTGQTPTLAVFSTFAVMDQRENRDKIWSMLTVRDRKRWNRDAFDRKMMDRSKWAYQELSSLLRWADSNGMDVQAYRGSVMGAIGWAQFLPSSLVRYGMDGDQDGVVDLFTAQDAIFSVANYLRGHGWTEARTEAEKERVIYAYNHSRPYCEAVLGIADRLRL